jgi:glycerol kinase
LFDAYDNGVKLGDSVENSGAVVFVPAFTGLGSPHWAPEVRGGILGLTGASTSAT